MKVKCVHTIKINVQIYLPSCPPSSSLSMFTNTNNNIYDIFILCCLYLPVKTKQNKKCYFECLKIPALFLLFFSRSQVAFYTYAQSRILNEITDNPLENKLLPIGNYLQYDLTKFFLQDLIIFLMIYNTLWFRIKQKMVPKKLLTRGKCWHIKILTSSMFFKNEAGLW